LGCTTGFWESECFYKQGREFFEAVIDISVLLSKTLACEDKLAGCCDTIASLSSKSFGDRRGKKIRLLKINS
jgi:hypothetical protein